MNSDKKIDICTKSTSCLIGVALLGVVGMVQVLREPENTINTSHTRRELASAANVKRIALLGERHSGTNWITNHLRDCFGDSIPVHEQYTRFKHWFQDENLEDRPETAVVLLTRDPYDWVEAMRVEPHHALDHVNWHVKEIDPTEGWRTQGESLTWREFVTTPWIGRRGPMDDSIDKTPGGKKAANCMDGYSFEDAAPCTEEDSPYAVGLGHYKYEFQHDGSQRGFASIINLRSAKILNHMSVADFAGVSAFFQHRFEDLNHKGTAELIKELEQATGRKAKCEPTMGSARRLRQKNVVHHKEPPKDFIKWMNHYVDWEVEAKIGYTKREEKNDILEGVDWDENQ